MLDDDRFRGYVRRNGNKWAWTVFDTHTGDPVAEGFSASQKTAMLNADAWFRHNGEGAAWLLSR